MNTLGYCPSGTRLHPNPTEFEAGIFMAAYGSTAQRRRRALAISLLTAKHTARGLLFSWPAYVLALAVFHSQQLHALAYLLLLVPALILSVVILVRGVRDDYRRSVQHVLLPSRFARALLWPPAP